MYQQPSFRHDFSLSKCVGQLFERIIYAFSEQQLLARLDKLLTLPVPTEAGFDVPQPRL